MVYLIHLVEPYKHAQHYLGWCERDEMVQERLAKHQAGIGSKFLAAVNMVGISYFIARCWPGFSRTRERQLKNRKRSRDLCPICNPKLKK